MIYPDTILRLGPYVYKLWNILKYPVLRKASEILGYYSKFP